ARPAVSVVQQSLHRLDELARADSPVHRLDPRAKVVATLAFAVAVVSFGTHEVAGLLPFALYPVTLAAAAGLPPGFLVRQALPALPFVVLVAAFNPFFDTRPLVSVAGVTLSGGWVSFFSIVVRGLLTVSAALLLVATTGMGRLCGALVQLGVPRVFAVQLLFLYRYLFVLLDEAGRLARARAVRSFRRDQATLAVFGSMAGQLLLRTLDRSQRISRAMYSRGFDGTVRTLQPPRLRPGDGAFVLGCVAAFLALRLWPLPPLLGRLAQGVAP
ncbi:MAG: cobalt ECF transporter T component CbiQ, partial [Candidatus Latescibacterota bacterium]